MNKYTQIIQHLIEQKQSVKNWQAGVRSSQLAGIPDTKRLADADFSAGYQLGMEKGEKALDPSNRAKRVKKLQDLMRKNKEQ
jgi:hypothetical protein